MVVTAAMSPSVCAVRALTARAARYPTRTSPSVVPIPVRTRECAYPSLKRRTSASADVSSRESTANFATSVWTHRATGRTRRAVSLQLRVPCAYARTGGEAVLVMKTSMSVWTNSRPVRMGGLV